MVNIIFISFSFQRNQPINNQIKSAAGSGNTESLKLLLEVNEFQLFLKRVDKDGLSVIHAAALSQNADSLLFLLKKTGAKEFLNSPDNRYNFTPLHYAVEHENVLYLISFFLFLLYGL